MLLLEEIPAGIEHGVQRHQADQFRASHTHAAGLRFGTDFVERHVDRRDADVGEVHGNLGDAVFLDEPADALNAFQRAGDPDVVAGVVFGDRPGQWIAFALLAAFLAHVEGNGVGPTGGSRIEVDVVGYEKIPGAHRRGARFGIELRRPEVGFPFGFGELVFQPLVFSGAYDGQVAALVREGCVFVAIDRDADFLAEAPRQLAGMLGGFFHGNVRDRNQRADVGGSESRVFAVVLAHVDEPGGFLHCPERGFDHRFRRSDEGDHRAVGGLARIDIQQRDALDSFDFVGDLLDDVQIAPFAEIGHALDELAVHALRSRGFPWIL